MKNIVDGLFDKDTGDLRDIAKRYNILKWEDAKRRELVNKIEMRMREPGFEKEMMKKLDDDKRIFLDEVLNGNNYEPVENVKQRYLNIKTTSDFQETYDELLSLGIIFEGKRDDKEIVYVPNETSKWLKQILSEKQV